MKSTPRAIGVTIALALVAIIATWFVAFYAGNSAGESVASSAQLPAFRIFTSLTSTASAESLRDRAIVISDVLARGMTREKCTARHAYALFIPTTLAFDGYCFDVVMPGSSFTVWGPKGAVSYDAQFSPQTVYFPGDFQDGPDLSNFAAIAGMVRGRALLVSLPAGSANTAAACAASDSGSVLFTPLVSTHNRPTLGECFTLPHGTRILAGTAR